MNVMYRDTLGRMDFAWGGASRRLMRNLGYKMVAKTLRTKTELNRRKMAKASKRRNRGRK